MNVGSTTSGAGAPGTAVTTGQPSGPQAGGRRRFPVKALIPMVVIVGATVWWFRTRAEVLPPNLVGLSGRIEGDESAVATKPGGRVLQITVREGDHVVRGQLIAVLDDTQVRARVDQARDAVGQADAQVSALREQVAVERELLTQSRLAVGQAQLDTEGRMFQARQTVVGADAGILAAQERVASARAQIGILTRQLEQSRLGVGQAVQDAQGRVAQAEQQVAAAEASLAQTAAQHDQAAADAVRYRTLGKEGAVSTQTVEQAITAERGLSASVTALTRQVEAARGALTTARANLTNPAVRRAQEAAVREQIVAARADLAYAEAQVTQMRAAREQASGGLTAVRAILTNPNVRASQETAAARGIALAERNLSAALATAQQARAKLVEAEADRTDLKVYAPFDGTITTRVAEPGEILAPGATVVTLVDLGTVYLRGYIPEGQIGRVRVGQAARIALDSDPKHPVEAFVSRIDPEASFTPENTYFRDDRVTQVVGVKLQVRTGIGFAKPGMPADGEVLVSGTWPAGSPR